MRVRWKSTRKNNKKPKAANIKSKIDHKPNGGPEMKISGEREKENTKLIYAPFVFWVCGCSIFARTSRNLLGGFGGDGSVIIII